MGQKQLVSTGDLGAAMMAWYGDALKQFPDGLVTQSQAATMLGVNRMAVSRLVARGLLRAVYFPKPPDIEGIVVGEDDPTWIKIAGWLGGEASGHAFAKAAYVSFGDVVDLWQNGEGREKCRRDWNEIMAEFLSKEKRHKRLSEISAQCHEDAKRQRINKPRR